MTQKALIECLATIDSHFGKQPSPEARRAEIQVYISVLGNIPDEIALKALPAPARTPRTPSSMCKTHEILLQR